MKQNFDITGMSCASCSARVEKGVSAVDGVKNVSVNLLKNSMTVDFDESITDAQKIISAVENCGYGATLKAENNPKINEKKQDSTEVIMKKMRLRLIVSLIFTIPLFYISMGHMAGWYLPDFLLGEKNIPAFAFTQFLLVLPVIFVNAKYYTNGFKSLFKGSPNMDSLIAIGSAAAVLYGIYAIYGIIYSVADGNVSQAHSFGMNLYFESAGMILTLITLGKYFETRAKRKTSDAISKLMDLSPKTATAIRDGKETEISVSEIKVGDILVVKSGESIPTDGVITEGNGTLDESALTGESIPVEKTVGDSVIGATISKSGYFKMRAEKVGTDTALSQIIKLVDEATSSKAPVEKLADKVSGIFVPIVITVAVIATVVWLLLGYGFEFALSIGISVLVISCPCALGLATPTAVMVGTGRGAANGILIKSAESLETAHSIDTVVFDKTGTITMGEPSVTDIICFDDTDRTELLSAALSIERLSEHPLSRAIVKQAEQENITPFEITGFQQYAGYGV
ncbi:MAG: heavy metal translocating P-type ATPase, partial [Acutalibacteraceae bacterium]